MINRYVLFLLSAFLATPIAEALGQGERPDWMWHTSWSWGHMILGMIMMILFWGTIIVLIVLLVRWLWGHAGPQSSTPAAHKAPLDILKERFARGEIDKQEYEERRKLLSE